MLFASYILIHLSQPCYGVIATHVAIPKLGDRDQDFHTALHEIYHRLVKLSLSVFPR
jgi:hypothetical protein